MSASQEKIDNARVAIQEAIDLLDPNAHDGSSRFELKDLFSSNDWQTITENLRYAKSLTVAFKKRIRGYPRSVGAFFTNVQVEDIRQNGRERMFRRIVGDHT